MTAPALLRGVDLAAFAAALVARLRAGGVAVAASGPAAFVAAMRALVPTSRTQLYWAARLALVNRVEDLDAFEAVFEAVFADAVLPLDPVTRRVARGVAASPVPAAGRRDDSGPQSDGLPWTTRPPSLRTADSAVDAAAVPDVLPSRIVARAEEPFEKFDDADLRVIGRWLERAVALWPTRRTLRTEGNRHGKRIDLRATMRAARKTGWEPVVLERTRPRRRRRRVVLVCDLSRSMQPYAAIYLHLMRATALRQAGFHPEVFAFSTTLTRLTPIMAHRSPEVALARANAKVSDRYGGTHLGRSIVELLAPPHGAALRGAVVMIASDGWDSDPPEVLERALGRLKRRAAHLVWLNPRASAPGFQPLAGSMAAALPYCDLFLPAHSLTGLRELFDALARL
ncbi:VWA domain-containing protein [Mycobacterium crocinum]|uniref:VWA domain-containing protein n=1 Tax=Mycolicibacterium crocinum TaxID=388459 RepID=A0ABY3TMH0_9MYCO|nr:VWA domain-containing protein [Mycolicibacterium crocinum]MCV7215100.1 VWA domain-containing protein [Mycolicibacterium crocinum]ULN42160.1 VWA domain-containing protein [Mycolicibacterium crocinum]